VVVLQHRLRWDRWKDVCLCVEREETDTHMSTHIHRFLGRGGSGSPEAPCSCTLSIDLAIKKTGDLDGTKSLEYRLREKAEERHRQKKIVVT